MEVNPLRRWVPESLDFNELSRNEIWIEKEGTEDSTLEPYLKDGTVKVLESPQMDDLVLEKRVNERVEDPLREVAFSVLLDEVGSTQRTVVPSISYVREEDGDVFYGQKFLRDFGPLNDQQLNNLSDAAEYLEAAGQVTGTYNWLNITHGDLTSIYTSGPLRRLPESKNILFSGSHPTGIGIDLETAFFDEEPQTIEDHQSGLLEMNSKHSDEEYDAVRRTMQANIISRHLLDYFNRITETSLEDENGNFNVNAILRYENELDIGLAGRNEYRVDFGKLQDLEEEISGSTNTRLAEKLRQLDRAYEKGFDALNEDLKGRNGGFSAGFIDEANRYTTIPTEITSEQIHGKRTPEIAKMRWQEIYESLDKSLSGR
jgi:hypothetical protein